MSGLSAKRILVKDDRALKNKALDPVSTHGHSKRIVTPPRRSVSLVQVLASVYSRLSVCQGLWPAFSFALL